MDFGPIGIKLWNENQPEVFQTEVVFVYGRPRGMSVPKCLFFFQDLEGLTEVFGPMSAGISGPKLPLWADFSFLKDAGKNCQEWPFSHVSAISTVQTAKTYLNNYFRA